MKYGFDDTIVKAQHSQDTAFESLLDQYDYTPPRRGQFMEGIILRTDGDAVLVDVGLKRDAIVPRQDLNRVDEADAVKLERGERVSIYILRTHTANGDLLASISKGFEYEDWKQAESLLAEDGVIKLEVVGFNRGGLVVKFGRLRGFVPNSHIPGYRHRAGASEIQALKMEAVGSSIWLKPLEVDYVRRKLVFSGRRALDKARQHRLETLKVGDVVRGRVVSLVDFGAFVDLGEIDGLIHVSELAWRRVAHPGELLNRGDEVQAQIIAVDVEAERVSLSRKALLPDPWQAVSEKYQVGDLVSGLVTSVVNFGAFVALPEEVEGLVHVGEMEVGRGGTPEDVLKQGDEVLVRIVNIDPSGERIGLSLSQVTREEQADWMRERHEAGLAAERAEAEPAAAVTAEAEPAEAETATAEPATAKPAEAELADAPPLEPPAKPD